MALIERDGVTVKVGGTHAHFDEMAWPAPCERLGSIEYVLRYGTPGRGELLVAASVIAAYRELVTCPARKRESVVRRLRQAMDLLSENPEPAATANT